MPLPRPLLFASLLRTVRVRDAPNFMPPDVGSGLKPWLSLSVAIEFSMTELSFREPTMPSMPARLTVTWLTVLLAPFSASPMVATSWTTTFSTVAPTPRIWTAPPYS